MAGKKPGRGRPSFKPTDENKELVRQLVMVGVSHEQIAMAIGIGARTLYRYFREELDTAACQANAKVAQSLFHNAVVENNVAAQIFWMKTRAGWKEAQRVEVVQERAPQTVKLSRGEEPARVAMLKRKRGTDGGES